jgi:endonuclease YncB( thermonuclease family)
MARAFIHNGVWRIQPSLAFDAPAQKMATLRVSIAAALATLAMAAMPERAPDAAPRARPMLMAQPVMMPMKIEDRVPSLPEAISPFRRRPPMADAPVEPSETTAATRTARVSEAVEALDAGTVRAGTDTFRLAGIVTPETGASCRRLDGLAVPCADRAHSYLQLLVKGRAIVCARAPQLGDGQPEANCRVGDADIAEQLVRQGWARAADKPEERLVLAEAAAKKQKLGIWRE